MKIPKKITIAGHEINVIFEQSEGRFPNAGDYCAWNNVMHINMEGTTESVRGESFLHEIIEAINLDNELNLEHPKITTLASQLFAIIRNNKLDFRKKEEK